MIATITLNPAVDKTLNASRIVSGAVNRIEKVTNMAGGKGINVAKVLRQFGYEVKTLGFLGGYTGTFIAKNINEMGAVDCFTRVAGETRTSINVITEEGYITELLEPGPTVSEEELDIFTKNYIEGIKDCDIVVLSGSVPKGVPTDIYAKLIDIAKEDGKKVLLDTSGEYLKQGIKALPYMIKPNMKELETLLGKRIHGMQEVAESASFLNDQGIENVLVSMGSRGILYSKKIDGKIEQYYVMAPSIRVINSVGSGDSAVAAFAMSVLEGRDNEATVRHCVAISVANALSLENGVIPMDEAKNIESNLKLTVPIL